MCILTSEIFIYFTPSTAPSNSPQSVTATAISPNKIEVWWLEVPAINQNGVITIYEIQIVCKETFGVQFPTTTVNTTNGSVLMVVLTGLEEYVVYCISVRAYTSAGPGPYSDIVVERTHTAGMHREFFGCSPAFHSLSITLQHQLHLLRMLQPLLYPLRRLKYCGRKFLPLIRME